MSKANLMTEVQKRSNPMLQIKGNAVVATDQEQIEKTDRWEQEVRAPTEDERSFFEEALGALPGPTTRSNGIWLRQSANSRTSQ